MSEPREVDGQFAVMRMRQLRECVGVSSSTIYDWMNAKSPRYDSTFPRPIKLGGSAVGWFVSDVRGWLVTRAAAGSRCLPQASQKAVEVSA